MARNYTWEEVRAAVIEAKEIEDDDALRKWGLVTDDAAWEPDLDYIVKAVRTHRYNVNYRRQKNTKDTNIIKHWNKLPEATRKELEKQLQEHLNNNK